jgi:hypothetical protein
LIPALIGLASAAAPLIGQLITKDPSKRALVNEVSEIAKRAAGVDDEQRALETLRADPAAYAEFAAELERLQQRELDAILADVQSARERDVEIRRISGGENWRANLMLAMAFIGLSVTMYLGATYADGEFQSLVYLVAGALLKMIGDAFAFEFGSSRGSKNKDAQITSLTNAVRRPFRHD